MPKVVSFHMYSHVPHTPTYMYMQIHDHVYMPAHPCPCNTALDLFVCGRRELEQGLKWSKLPELTV